MQKFISGKNERGNSNAASVAAHSARHDARAVLDKTHKLIVEAALTGFNPHDGDWAERLYRNQGAIHDVLHNKKD